MIWQSTRTTGIGLLGCEEVVRAGLADGLAVDRGANAPDDPVAEGSTESEECAIVQQYVVVAVGKVLEARHPLQVDDRGSVDSRKAGGIESVLHVLKRFAEPVLSPLGVNHHAVPLGFDPPNFFDT